MKNKKVNAKIKKIKGIKYPELEISHDALVRKSFENAKLAQQFFETRLPENVVNMIDFASLKSSKETFVEEGLKKSLSDVLFYCKFNGTDGYLYLLVEHQSNSDHWISFRLLRYIVNILEHHKLQHPETKKLPAIYATVLYNGKSKYTASKNLFDLFEQPELARMFFDKGYNLVDVTACKDEDLKKSKKLWAAVMELSLKHVFEHDLNILAQIIRMLHMLKMKGEDEHMVNNYIEIVLCYYNINKQELEQLKYQVKEEEDTMANVFAERFKEGVEVGFEKGIEQGIEKGIEAEKVKHEEEKALVVASMLQDNLPLHMITKYSNLSIKAIEDIKLRLTNKK